MNNPAGLPPQQGQPAERKPADAMVTEVAKAYYPRAVAAADSARSRAQAGYTIASAIAAALVAAGIFSGIDERGIIVQGLGILALSEWLLAAFFFMLAVSERRPDPQESTDPQKLQEHPGALAFVKYVMSDSKGERNAVEDHQRSAVVVTGVAMLLTLATIIGVLVDQPPDQSKHGTFTLLPSGQSAIRAACRQRITTLQGNVDPSKLKDDFVPVTVDAGDCQSVKVTLRLRQKFIATVVLAP